MAESSESKGARTLEMRIAELEDKLAKLHVTDEEMRAYQKVAALMGGGAGGVGAMGGMGGAEAAAAPQPSAAVCTISRSRLACIVPRQIVRFCNECTCGPCIQGGGFGGEGGGGFGGFGM